MDDIQADQKKAKTLILADIAYKLSQNGSSGLAYAAIQLQGAKDAKRVTEIFTEANVKGDALEVVDRDQTLGLIKMGPVDATLVDTVADYMKQLEEGTAANVRVAQIPVQAAMTALLGSFNNLPPDLKEQAIQSFAQMEGKDFDAVVSDVRANRILNGTASDPKTPIPDSEKKLDQRIYDDGVSLVKGQLSENGKAANAPAAATNEDRKRELEKAEAHLDAGIFLAGTLLTQIVPTKAHHIQDAGGAFAKMYDAMQRFGPGGVTPDKLLMCTNMVSAGILVAQLFAQQQNDPTMTALTEIMDQIKEINRKLEEIDKKIDRLTDITVEGFDRVLHEEHYTQEQLTKFSEAFQASVTEQNQRAALDEYLNYLRQDASAYKELLSWDSTSNQLPIDPKKML